MNQVKNCVFLIGNLGRDPEQRTLQNGRQMAVFTLATNETYRNNQGDRVIETQWHNCVAWGPLAETMTKYLKKGRQIAIQGKIRYNNYEDKNGNKQRRTDIVISDFSILDKTADKAAPATK